MPDAALLSELVVVAGTAPTGNTTELLDIDMPLPAPVPPVPSVGDADDIEGGGVGCGG